MGSQGGKFILKLDGAFGIILAGTFLRLQLLTPSSGDFRK